MNDLNFFEPYIAKQNWTEKKQLILYLMILLILMMLFSYSIINFIRIKGMKDEIAAMKTVLQSPEAVEKFQRIEEKQDRIDDINNRLLLIENTNKIFTEMNVIDAALVDEIINTMPQELFLLSMNVSPDMIILDGSSEDKVKIAEFEYNLRLSGVFQEIFVPSITQQEDKYNFTIQFKVKDVD